MWTCYWEEFYINKYSNVICCLCSVLFPVFSFEAVVLSAKSGPEKNAFNSILQF